MRPTLYISALALALVFALGYVSYLVFPCVILLGASVWCCSVFIIWGKA